MRFTAALPSSQLLTLDQARAHLRKDDSDEDAAITAAIAAASLRIDGPDSITGLAMLRRPHVGLGELADRVTLEVGPDAALTKVEVLQAGAWSDVTARFGLRRVRDQRADLVLLASQPLPAADDDEENLRVTVTAGFADAVESPRLAPVRQACLLLAAHYFENRAAAAFGGGYGELPMGVRALLKPYSRAME